MQEIYKQNSNFYNNHGFGYIIDLNYMNTFSVTLNQLLLGDITTRNSNFSTSPLTMFTTNTSEDINNFYLTVTGNLTSQGLVNSFFFNKFIINVLDVSIESITLIFTFLFILLLLLYRRKILIIY